MTLTTGPMLLKLNKKPPSMTITSTATVPTMLAVAAAGPEMVKLWHCT